MESRLHFSAFPVVRYGYKSGNGMDILCYFGEMAWVAVTLFVLLSLFVWTSWHTSVKNRIVSIFSSLGHVISVFNSAVELGQQLQSIHKRMGMTVFE